MEIAFHLQIPATGSAGEIWQRILDFRCDALIVRLPGEQLISFVHFADKQPRQIPILLPWMADVDLQQPALPKNTKLSILKPFSPQQTAIYADFAATYQSFYGCMPGAAAAYVYDATKIILTALSTCELNRIALRDAISRLSPYSGVTGVIEWDNTGGNVAIPVLVSSLTDAE
jgi:ABC-type branched-subunit amino acid transport system substrate-binding protein